MYNLTGESEEQQYPTWSQVAIRTSVAENVGNSGKALATSSLILSITSLSVVTLYHREPKTPVNKSDQNGAITGVLIGNGSGEKSENPLLKERSPLLFNYMIIKTRYIYIYIEKKVSLWLLCGVQHSVLMANFVMPETHQPIIVIILIIYSVYLL